MFQLRPPRRSVVRLLVVATFAVVATSSMTGTATAVTYTASPFNSKLLYVDPSSNAARDAAALAATDPASAAALTKIATRSQADWYGDWTPVDQVSAQVNARVTTIANAGAYPVLVTYDIPERDCHSYSGGGA